MPPVSLAFDDFWGGFNPRDNFLTRAISGAVEWRLDDDNPDILFFSNFGVRHLRRRSRIKIFYSGENLVPDFNQCDYAISAARLQFGARHLYLPPCLIAYEDSQLLALPPIEPDMARRPFCSFIYSQARVGEGSRLRKEFCQELMDTYAHVDCPGRILHNMDAPDLAARGDAANWNASKIRFLSRYKFNIAFENSSSPGYITEKLTDCFLGNTVPIYWGSGGDMSPFPREAMICADNYPDTASLVARIKEVNENDDLYLKMLAANPLRHGMQLSGRGALGRFLAPILQGERGPFDQDVWHFGDAARLARLGAAAGAGRARASYLLATLGLLLAGAKRRRRLRERRRELKYALRDLLQLRR